MKIKSFLLVLSLLLLAGCTTDFDEAVRIEEKELNDLFARKDVVANVMTVKFSRETTDRLAIARTRTGELTTGDVSLDEICREYEVVSMERVFSMDRFADRKREMGLDQWYIVRVSGRRAAGEAALQFQRNEGVISVAPQMKPKRIGAGTAHYLTQEEVEAISAKGVTRGSTLYNDPLLPEQWMLKNVGSESDDYGSYGFVEGADINVEGIWRQCGGSNNVIVAVVDGGIEYTHPDLAGNMWEGIGYNFVKNNKTVTTEEHGTHVAGTIAAVSNNGIGISGIAGGSGKNDGVKLMSCQTFTADDSATDADCARAIEFGADNGAVISQNSWGYPINYVSTDAMFAQRLGAIKDAIDYFVRYAGYDENGNQVGPMAGGVVIFAAGNDGKNQSEYPASYSNCLSVAAMTGTYKAAWYSTYSTAVDLFAPGGDGPNKNVPLDYPAWNLSTLPSHLKNGDTFKENGKTYMIDYVRVPGYGYMIGTSMACPHVSGAAALIVSYCGGEGFTNTRLKELLLNSAKDIDSYQDSNHKGKVGRLIDVTAAAEMGGPGTNYVPKNFPAIRPKNGAGEVYLLKGEKCLVCYEVENCDRIEVSDSKIKIATNEDGVLILEIDAAQYEEGSYQAEIKGFNDDGDTTVKLFFTVESVSADCYPNPFNEELNIRLAKIKGDWRNCDAHVEITNSIGAKVFDLDVEFEGRFPLHLNTEKLNPGRYTVKVDVLYENRVHTLTRTVVKR